MKFGSFLSTAALAVMVCCAVAQASTPSAPAKKPVHAVSTHVKPAPVAVAPMDEYFGKMKLSPLGINNTIHDTNLHVHYDPANGSRYYQSLEWAEDALHDWARKYPQDTWLPGRAYFMSHVFWQMHLPEADAAADRCRAMLFQQFPKSHWAALAHQETKEKIAPVAAATAQTQPAPAATVVAGHKPQR